MEQKKEQQMSDAFAESCQKIYSGIISVGVLLVLAIFPIYYRDYYYDILEAKYQFYYIAIFGMLGVLLLVSIAFLVIDALEFKLEYTKGFFHRFSLGEIRKTLTAADWFLLAFLVTGVISTLQSEYVYEAFWGNEGRYTGLFLHLLYGVSFWVVSRLYQFKRWHLYTFLSVAVLLLLFGITDFFKMDLLHFKVDISENDINDFTSTFGNINTYATYAGIILGCFSALFVVEEKGVKACLYYLGYMVTVLAVIMGNSDNAVFGITVVFAFLPLVAFQSRRGAERYLLLAAGFALGGQIVGWVSSRMAGQVIDLHGFFGTFSRIGALKILAVLGFLGALAIHWVRMKDEKHERENLGKVPVMVWGAFLILCLAAGIFMLYDANAAGNSARYGALGNYLKFSDEWGTYRGMIWRISLDSYSKQPLSHKIWGYGLDTFGVMTMDYRGETSRICGQVFDSAHNEYLQYLLTVGPIGLLAYLGFFASALIMLFKKNPEGKWGLAAAFGVSCYLAQAFVTINLPIVTPIMWMLLSVGVASCRTKRAAIKSHD